MNPKDEKFADVIKAEGAIAAAHFARNGVSRPSITELVEHYWDIFNAMGDVYLPTPNGPVKAACAKGCAMCCRTIIVLTEPEALLLADFIERTNSKEDLDKIIARVRAADAVTRGRNGDERWGFGPPCPLLDVENGACSVYGGRPFACRGAYSSSLQSCKKAFAERATNPRALGSEPFIYQNANILILAMAIGLKSAGVTLHRLELNAALTAIWSTQNAFGLWLAGEDIFKNARASGHAGPLA